MSASVIGEGRNGDNVKKKNIYFEKYNNKAEAMYRAKELAKTESYVVVIQSRADYYVETETNMIRSWEKVIYRHAKD